MGPGDLISLLPSFARSGGTGGRVLVGPESGDDAGVFQLGEHALVATADFIPPVCDDPRRFGRIAAVNSLSDVWAMGGEALFALNLCTFPSGLPAGVAEAILAGGLEAISGAGAVLLGGHTVKDAETKYGLAVVGSVPPHSILTLGGARPGQRLVLTKPLGTGVLINAFKFDRLDAIGLEPALAEMERPNREAARLAREYGATAATDITGFGFAGHAWNIARESRATLEIRFDDLLPYARFYDLVRSGVSTGCTRGNRSHVEPWTEIARDLAPEQEELLFDPQTSGGLLVALPADRADAYVTALAATGHRAVEVGAVRDGDARLRVL